MQTIRNFTTERPRLTALIGGTSLLALVVLWIMRTTPIVHDSVMLVSGQYPRIVAMILVIAAPCVVSLLIYKRASARTNRQYGVQYTVIEWFLMIASGLLAIVGMYAFLSLYGAMQGHAIHKDNKVKDITALPQVTAVRTVPYDVLDSMARNGFSSTTEEFENGHLVVQGGKIVMTHEIAPSGYIRRRTKSAQGIATQDTTVSERTLKTVKRGTWPVSPSTKGFFFNPTAWDRQMRTAVYRKHYTVKLQETSGIITPKGEILFVAPYVEYAGILVRRPVVGGVMVLHADGRLEDLSMDEARKRPEIAQSGRLLPESYVRQIHENIKYRNGVLNGKYGRREVYRLSGGGGNKQPYLTVLKSGRPAWISTALPKGKKNNATGAVFVTDAITGITEIWKPKKDEFITGNQRALAAVKERPIGGITWGTGNYEAIEPRPVLLSGKLHFLISIVPANRTAVALNVLFDAHRNKVVGVFDPNKGGDAQLMEVLRSGVIPTEATESTTSENSESDSTEAASPLPDRLDARGRQRAIEQLIEQNQREQKLLERLLEAEGR